MVDDRVIVLSRRALNRATLARQLLLERADLLVGAALEHLVGLQAQAPNAPYVALWSRLDPFRPEELARLVGDRLAVRGWLMRSTVHLTTARDYLALRPLLHEVAVRNFSGQSFAKDVADVDLDGLLAYGRVVLEERPLARSQLGPRLAERWPDVEATSLVYAVSYLLPVVQVPPRGLWGRSGPATLTTIEAWLGRGLDGALALDDLVLRYLGAFGPASVRDVQVWSGLSRLREVVERLSPQLRRFRDEDGTELFDLPDAPRPDPDVPAPPRFLPEYDNLLLSHANRARVIPDGRPVPLPPGNGARRGTVLVDGDFRATWRIQEDGDTARLVIEPFERLAAADRSLLHEEGAGLVRFAMPGAHHHDVVLSPPG